MEHCDVEAVKGAKETQERAAPLWEGNRKHLLVRELPSEGARPTWFLAIRGSKERDGEAWGPTVLRPCI